MAWHIHCFVKDDPVFPVNSYSVNEFKHILLIVKGLKNNPSSGIKTINIYHDESDRVFRFSNLEDAYDKCKLFETFS